MKKELLHQSNMRHTFLF